MKCSVSMVDPEPFGSDLKIVNIASVSFDKASDWLTTADHFAPYQGALRQRMRLGDMGLTDPQYGVWLRERDASLIRFLARGMEQRDWDKHIDFLMGDDLMDREAVERLVASLMKMPTHWAPFAHTAISLRIEAPINPVARQLQKSQIGLVWSEVSRRYVDTPPDFFDLDWRERAANVKQGSTDLPAAYPLITLTTPEGLTIRVPYKDVEAALGAAYVEAVNPEGAYRVAPEQARATLPQTMMTTWIWTGSIYAFARVCQQRLESHAQRETREVAQMISAIIEPWFPVTWAALLEGIR